MDKFYNFAREVFEIIGYNVTDRYTIVCNIGDYRLIQEKLHNALIELPPGMVTTNATQMNVETPYGRLTFVYD